MQGLGHYPTKALGHALGGILGKNAGHEAGHWAGETIRGGVHEWVTDGASGAAQHQGWKPDTFSTTAGAIDEGISGLAGLGGRKGGHRYYTGMGTPPPNRAGTTWVGAATRSMTPPGVGASGNRALIGDGPGRVGGPRERALVGGGGRPARTEAIPAGPLPSPTREGWRGWPDAVSAPRFRDQRGVGESAVGGWLGRLAAPVSGATGLGQQARGEGPTFVDAVPGPLGAGLPGDGGHAQRPMESVPRGGDSTAEAAVLAPPRFVGVQDPGGGRLEFIPAMTPAAAQLAATKAVGQLAEGPVRQVVQRRLTDLLTAGRPEPGLQTVPAEHAPAAADWPLLLDGGLAFLAGDSVVELSGALTDLVPVTGSASVAQSEPSHSIEQAAGGGTGAGWEQHFLGAVRLSLSVDGVHQAFDPVLPSQARIGMPAELVPAATGGQPSVGAVPGPDPTPWSVAASAVSVLSGVAPDHPVRSRFLAVVEEQQSGLGPAWARWTSADPVVHGLLLIDAIDHLGYPAGDGPAVMTAAVLPGVPELRAAAVAQTVTALAVPTVGAAAAGPAVEALTRASLTVLALAERSPALAARLTTSLFEVALGEQAPDAVPAEANGSRGETALAVRAAVRSAATAVAGMTAVSAGSAHGREVVIDSGSRTALVTAVRHAVQAITVAATDVAVAPKISAAAGSTPSDDPSVTDSTVTVGAVVGGTASANPPTGRGGGRPPRSAAHWWRRLFDRPVSVAWPLSNETLVEAPARAAVPAAPEYRTPAPVGDPVVAAAESVEVRARTLVRRALADPPSLQDIPGRSRVARAVTAVLPFLGAAPLRRVFALHPTEDRAFSDDLPRSRSVVREAAREQAQRVWPQVSPPGLQPTGKSPVALSQEATPVPGARDPRAGVPDRVDRAWHDQQLAALMRAAAVQRMGRTAVADLVSARTEVQQLADSVTALQQSSRVVADGLREQQAAVTADLVGARRDRIRAEKAWQRAVLQEQVTRTAVEHVSTQDPAAPDARAFAILASALQGDLEAARTRRTTTEQAWRRAQAAEQELREQQACLAAHIDDLADRRRRVAVDHAAAQARLAAQTLDAAVRAATDVHRREVREMNRNEAHTVEAILRHPPGFPDHRSSDQLRSRLAQLQLELPIPGSDAALPEAAVLRLIVDGLALVTDDPARAERLLAALMDHGITDLIPAPDGSHSHGHSSFHADALADLRALWRDMTDVKRGLEALALVAQRHASPARGDTLDALAVYWTADATLQTLPVPAAAVRDTARPPTGDPTADSRSPQGPPLGQEERTAHGEPSDVTDLTRQWLEAARRAAAHRLHGHPFDGIGDRDRAAFNGVSNGLLVIGPGSTYEQLNAWVHTVAEVWTRRAADRAGGVEAPFSDVVRLEGTTPLHPRLVRGVDRLGPAFGFATRGVHADRWTAAGARKLARYTQDRLTAALRAGRPPDTTELVAAAGAAWITGLPDHGLARRQLTPADHPCLSAAISEQMALAHHTLTLQGLPAPTGVPAPALLAAVHADLAAATARGETALRVLVRWASALAPPDGSRADAGLRVVKADLEEALRFGADRGGRVGDQAGLVDFLDPMLAEWDVRQGLRMVQGRSAGLALPVPWYLRTLTRTLTLGVLPTAEAGHRRDVFLDVQYPSSMGIQVAVGRQRSTAGSLGATFAGFVGLPWVLKLALGLGVTARAGTSSAEGLLLRLPRVRGQEAAVRRTSREVLDELAFWATAVDETGRPFDDPLQYMLSRHPDLTVTPLDARQSTTAVDASLRAALPIGFAGRWAAAGPQVVLGAGAERTSDHRTETAGRFRSAHDHASTAAQRIRFGIGLPASLAGQALSTGVGDGGRLANPTQSLQAGLTRELYQRLERRRINDMSIGRTGEADFDRVTDDPAPLLSETAVNELGWVRRGMDTMEGIPAELMPTFGRDLARARMLRFRQELRHLGRTTTYPVYTVRYSRQPQAQTHLDITQSLATLARQRRDHTTARRWAATRDTLLLHPSTWRPRTVFARERGSRTRTRGFALLIRGQSHEQVEVNRTAAQFPPP
ncbi:MAG TPA: hypothetical protein VFP72_19310 [Kineosporiaceae bacterium]|nr:hypothetical protein [Kineosporiaceae bacterium]